MATKNYNSIYEQDMIDKLNASYDATSYIAIASTGLTTAGATQSASTIIDIGNYQENTLYVDSSAVVARAAATGLLVTIQTRPASAIAWQTIRAESGVDESGLTIFKIVGSGNANTSGMTHFKDIRIEIDNISDSGSATVQAWMFSRTPN